MEGKTSDRKWWHINRDMLPIKLAYFLFGMLRSSITPYLTIFFTSIGFSVSQAGVITAAKSLGYISGSVFWSVLADKTGAQRTILIIMLTLNILFTALQPFFSAWLGPPSYNRCPIQKNATMVSGSLEGGVVSWSTFYYLFVFINLVESFNRHQGIFLQEVMIRRVRRSTIVIQIGRQIVCVSIGFGIATIISGQILEYFPSVPISCYLAVFLYWLVVAIFLLILLQVIFTHETKYKHEKSKSVEKVQDVQQENTEEEAFFRVLWNTLSDFDMAMHYMAAFVMGFVYKIYLAYIFLFVKQLTGSNILIGLIVATGSTSAAFTTFFLEWLIKRCGGVWNSYAVAAGIFAVRFFAFSLIRNPWIIIPLQIFLHGLSVSFPLSVHLEFVKRRKIPAKVSTTVLGIQSCLGWGLGPVCGSLFGGWVYQQQGARKMFWITGIISAVWCVLVIVYIIFKRLRERGSHSLEGQRKQHSLVVANNNNTETTGV